MRLRYYKMAVAERKMLPESKFEQMLEKALAPSGLNQIKARVDELYEALGGLQDQPEESEDLPQTIEEIANKFEARRAAILNSQGHSQDDQGRLLTWLNREEAHAVEQFFRKHP